MGNSGAGEVGARINRYLKSIFGPSAEMTMLATRCKWSLDNHFTRLSSMNIKHCGSLLARLGRRWSPLLFLGITIACGPSDRQRTENVRIYSELKSAYMELRLSYPENNSGKKFGELQELLIAKHGDMLKCSVDGTCFVTNPDSSLWNADPEGGSREIAILYPVRRKNDQRIYAFCGIDFTGQLRWVEDAPAWLPR